MIALREIRFLCLLFGTLLFSFTFAFTFKFIFYWVYIYLIHIGSFCVFWFLIRYIIPIWWNYEIRIRSRQGYSRMLKWFLKMIRCNVIIAKTWFLFNSLAPPSRVEFLPILNYSVPLLALRLCQQNILVVVLVVVIVKVHYTSHKRVPCVLWQQFGAFIVEVDWKHNRFL